MTVYALFFDDIRLIAFAHEYDDIFFGITLLGMILFSLEIALSTYATPRYSLSFFFWLVLVSTISMIPDCGWIWSAIIDHEAGGGKSGAADLAKNSRAGRITRVIRIIRLIRFIRIVKLYKQA